MRTLRNRFARQFQELEQAGASFEELSEFGAGRLARAARDGDVTHGSVMAGQGAGLVKQIMPVRDIIQELVKGVQSLIHELEGQPWQD